MLNLILFDNTFDNFILQIKFINTNFTFVIHFNNTFNNYVKI